MTDSTKRTGPGLVPMLLVAGLCAGSFYAGGVFNSVTPNGKYLLADKNAVIVNAVLTRDSTDAETLRTDVAQPILNVLRRYTDLGYVVIESSRDEQGNHLVAAIPAGTRDITHELELAITKQEQSK
jgi:hypothetical protein